MFTVLCSDIWCKCLLYAIFSGGCKIPDILDAAKLDKESLAVSGKGWFYINT